MLTIKVKDQSDCPFQFVDINTEGCFLRCALLTKQSGELTPIDCQKGVCRLNENKEIRVKSLLYEGFPLIKEIKNV